MKGSFPFLACAPENVFVFCVVDGSQRYMCGFRPETLRGGEEDLSGGGAEEEVL